ncbi:MAG: hypothetical protein CMB80_02435 [Flammeovirgaceae bacterium]|nr:hypothetical protein [Flammeovirgaceae bacterium]
MAIGRYAYTARLRGRTQIATSQASSRIYEAVMSGRLAFTSSVLKGDQRLDHIAGAAYGSSTMWWVIAAASGIGWGLQVPPGTILRIPKNIGEVIQLIR